MAEEFFGLRLRVVPAQERLVVDPRIGSRTCCPEHKIIHISHIAALVADLAGRTMQLAAGLPVDLLLE